MLSAPMGRRVPCLLLGLVCLAVPALHADTIVAFTNFGPGYTASANGATWVGNDNEAGAENAAQEFTPTATGDFSGAILDIGETVSASHTAILDLDDDNGGFPGSTLEEISVFVDGFAPGNLVTFDSVLDPLLTAGDSYWIVVSADIDSGQPTNQLLWMASSDPAPGSGGFQCTGVGCATAGPGAQTGAAAFEIDESVVLAPEPAPVLLAPLGLIMLLAARNICRRRKAQLAIPRTFSNGNGSI